MAVTAGEQHGADSRLRAGYFCNTVWGLHLDFDRAQELLSTVRTVLRCGEGSSRPLSSTVARKYSELACYSDQFQDIL